MAVIAEKLIEIVQRHPIIYNLRHEDYKNMQKKDKIWQEIADELGEDGDELRKKWKNLRDSYWKHLKSLKISTDQSAGKRLYKWQWAKQMEVFRPFMTPWKRNDTSSSISSSKNNKGIGSTAKRKKINKQVEQESPTTKHLKPTHKDNHNGESNKDAIDLIFSGYVKTVKNFSPRLQVRAKLKFAELMSHLELEHQQERSGFIVVAPHTRRSPLYTESQNTISQAIDIKIPPQF